MRIRIITPPPIKIMVIIAVIEFLFFYKYSAVHSIDNISVDTRVLQAGVL